MSLAIPLVALLVLLVGVVNEPQNAYAGFEEEPDVPLEVHCEDLEIEIDYDEVEGYGYCDIEFESGETENYVPFVFWGDAILNEEEYEEETCIEALDLNFHEDYEQSLGGFDLYIILDECVSLHEFHGDISGTGEVTDSEGLLEGLTGFVEFMGELWIDYYEGEGEISIWITSEPVPQVTEVHCEVEYEFEMFLIWGEREGYGECIYIFSDGSEEEAEVHVSGEFEVGSLEEGFRTIEGTFHIEDYDDNALWLFEEGDVEIDCDIETEEEEEFETPYCLETEATVEEGEGIFDFLDGSGTRTAEGYFTTEFIFTEGYAYSTIWIFFDCPECEPEEPEFEKSGGGSCNNCQPPTLGLNKQGDTSPDQVRVHGGFKCNGQSVDVQHYYTDFPLIENRVGEPLRCTFKVYEDTGADNVRHFEFAVGKRAGDSMSEEQGKIVWDRNHLLVATTTYDQNLFRDVYITTGLAKCRTDSANSECLQINLSATPKSPLVEDIIVKTNVWDQRRNAKTNFYNDGIDFVGNTENALPTYNVLDGRNGNVVLYTMDPTLENLDFAIDENGYNWYVNNNGFWQKEYIAPDTSCSVSTYIGYDRTCPEFAILKQGQILLAQEYFNSADIQSEIGESFAYEFPEQTDRLAGTQLG